MTYPIDTIERGLTALGDLLGARGLSYELVLIGGGALLLQELVRRPTEDLDVVAFFSEGELVPSKPFPPPLQQAMEEVGRALGLPLQASHGKDWLNPGPTILRSLGLPPGFQQRLHTRRFGSLTVHLASRLDLLHLKLLSATDIRRPGSRKQIDLDDIRQLAPSRQEILQAARWVERWDGRPDFFELELRPFLARLGFELEELDD